MQKRIALAVFFILFTGVGAYVYIAQRQAQTGEMVYSGSIEATQANVAFQAAGRVATVAVQEGQAVKAGQTLAVLDPAEFASRLEQAQANLERSRAARAQLESMLALYEQTLPEDVARAQANKASAVAVAADARKNLARYEQLLHKGVAAQREYDSVRLVYDTARARQAELEAVLGQAKGGLMRIAATRKDIAGVAAQIRQAEAAVAQAAIQLGYATLNAPFDGIITSRSIEPGEVVTPGREVFSIADLARVDLKIFVDESSIGRVRPGQAVEVRVDSFPDTAFKGRVAYISPEAEFTPKIIQTKKERVKLVYLVKVSIANPQLRLKAGMPADAWLR